jgi:hypothetical protein
MANALTKTPGQMLKEAKSRYQGNGIFLFIVAVEVFIHLWTLSHNIPLLISGLSGLLLVIGGLAAATGEVFSFGSLVCARNTAGEQRMWALIGHIVMLAVLILNSVIWTNAGTLTAEWNFYRAFIAPAMIMIIAAVGAYQIYATDPNAKIRDSELKLANVALAARVASIEAMANQLATEIDDQANQQQILDGARTLAGRAVRDVTGQATTLPFRPGVPVAAGNGHTPEPIAPPPPPELPKNAR